MRRPLLPPRVGLVAAGATSPPAPPTTRISAPGPRPGAGSRPGPCAAPPAPATGEPGGLDAVPRPSQPATGRSATISGCCTGVERELWKRDGVQRRQPSNVSPALRRRGRRHRAAWCSTRTRVTVAASPAGWRPRRSFQQQSGDGLGGPAPPSRAICIRRGAPPPIPSTWQARGQGRTVSAGGHRHEASGSTSGRPPCGPWSSACMEVDGASPGSGRWGCRPARSSTVRSGTRRP